MSWRVAIACAALGGSAGSFAVVACSSFSGDTPVETEAAVPPADDASTPDAGGPFCDRFRDASFCFSFDDGVDPRVGAKLAIQSPPEPGLTDVATSPPHALAVDVDYPAGPKGLDAGPSSGVVLRVTGAGTHAHCDMSLWADQVDPDAGAATANVDVIFVALATGQLFDFSVKPVVDSDALFAQTGIPGPHSLASNFGRATWLAIGFDLEVVDGKVQVHGSAGGTDSKPIANDGGPNVTALGNFTMTFGASFVTGHWMVHFDDIVCNWN